MHGARDRRLASAPCWSCSAWALAEFGLVEAQGVHKVERLIAIVMDEIDARVPDIAHRVLKVIVSQIEDILGKPLQPRLLLLRLFCPVCIINTRGYDFREGQQLNFRPHKDIYEIQRF